MKIVLAAGIFPPDIGGPARYATMLVDGLPREGISVTVVPYHSVRTYPKLLRHLAYAYRLWRASKGAAAIYALDPISVGVPAAMVAYLRQLPLVVRLGGDYAWEQGVQRFGVTDTLDVYTAQPQTAAWPVRVLAGIQRLVVRRAVAVVLPSQYLRSVVATWGVAADRLHVIYSAHTVPDLSLDRDAVRADLGFVGPTLVSIARLTPWKGMDTLIRVVAARQTRGETVSLVIGGDGPERARLEALARELGVSDQVRFMGALTFAEVMRPVRAADIFLLDTAYEGLSHQLIEVMAIGTPIITTPVGGNPELLTHEEQALLVPVGDVAAYDEAITRLLSDESLAARLVASAKERAAGFAATDAVPQIAQLLRTVTGNTH